MVVMQMLLAYLLKVIIYSGILFGYYTIALRNKRFHYYNRFYLLMSVAISLLLPLLHMELWQLQSHNPQVVQLMNVIVTNASEKTDDSNALHFSPELFVFLSYCLIAFCLLLSFFTGILKIFRFKQQYPVEQLGSVSFINTDLQQAPFSFFNNLFWKNSISLSEETGQQIFRHELTHIEQKHSWDKVFLRLATLIFWANPFYWLMQKELSLIHEFIADEKAIENKNAEAFALMLLQSQYAKAAFSPAQSFHYSPIKRRLLMLTTSQRTSFSYVRRLLVLPLLAVLTFLFAFTLHHNDNSKTIYHATAPFTLIVDAGHGGEDDGAIGINDATEKTINLSIAKKIQELAPAYGITVKMTRTNDETVSLQSRMDFIKSQQPDACVSIHVNNTPEKETTQHEMNAFITRNNSNSNYEQSRLLGSSLLQAAKNDFAINATLMQRKEHGIYIIDQNPYPAVILECGYMNNAENLRQLTDDAKTEQMARDILQGIVSYANAEHTSVMVTDTMRMSPLYMVDGNEMPAEKAQKIDANKIESVNVLKDTAAIKKYGEKGKNGVVEITMKKLSSMQQSMIEGQPDDGYSKALQDVQNTKYSDALKVVDGTIVSDEEFGKIRPQEIYGVNVLDANAGSEKWGSKGQKGVIEVALKSNGDHAAKPVHITMDKSILPDTSKPPLYIVNGKEMDKDKLGTLSPGDIASINIISGAEAISQYGEKGRNGVAVITMKEGTTYTKQPAAGDAEDNVSKQYGGDYQSDESVPTFKGGNKAWQTYLIQNLKVSAVGKGPAGTYTVMVSFKVDENGKVSDVKATNNPGYGTAAEAVRVIKESPDWIPAKRNGKTVSAETKQPITFQKV